MYETRNVCGLHITSIEYITLVIATILLHSLLLISESDDEAGLLSHVQSLGELRNELELEDMLFRSRRLRVLSKDKAATHSLNLKLGMIFSIRGVVKGKGRMVALVIMHPYSFRVNIKVDLIK